MAIIDRLYFVINHTSSEHRISDVLCKGKHRSFQHIACSPWIILPDQHVYVWLSVPDQHRSANNQQVDGSHCLHDINSVRTQHNQQSADRRATAQSTSRCRALGAALQLPNGSDIFRPRSVQSQLRASRSINDQPKIKNL